MVTLILILYKCSHIQGELLFSIQTAEQSLLKYQPELVSKLKASRNTKLENLKNEITLKHKALDQRSKATGLANCDYLEGFVEKAASCKIKVQLDTNNLIEELLNLSNNIDHSHI